MTSAKVGTKQMIGRDGESQQEDETTTLQAGGLQRRVLSERRADQGAPSPASKRSGGAGPEIST